MNIVERLRFDAARCEVDYSKGVAGNITEAADEIERLRATLTSIEQRPDTPEHVKAVIRARLGVPPEQSTSKT